MLYLGWVRAKSRELRPVWHPFHSIQIIMLIRLTKFRCLATSDSLKCRKIQFLTRNTSVERPFVFIFDEFERIQKLIANDVFVEVIVNPILPSFSLSRFNMIIIAWVALSSLTIWVASKLAITLRHTPSPCHYATNCQQSFLNDSIYYQHSL